MLHGYVMRAIILNEFERMKKYSEKRLDLEFINVNVFRSDEIKDIDNNYIFIVNTQCEQNKDAHWLVCQNDGRNFIFFDSFGKHPRDFIDEERANEFDKFLSSALKNYPLKYNRKKYQNEESTLCGGYALLFVLFAFHRATDDEKRWGVLSEKLSDFQNFLEHNKRIDPYNKELSYDKFVRDIILEKYKDLPEETRTILESQGLWRGL
nr:uncharacterized protein LOC107446753 [Parasteatoda tepidariorum]